VAAKHATWRDFDIDHRDFDPLRHILDFDNSLAPPRSIGRRIMGRQLSIKETVIDRKTAPKNMTYARQN